MLIGQQILKNSDNIIVLEGNHAWNCILLISGMIPSTDKLI